MKVIIAGGRTFDNQSFLNEAMDSLRLTITEVVSGKQKTWDKERKVWCGADYQGEHWAALARIPVKPFPAKWKELGRAAGPIRNRQMAEYADYLVAFWDGKSKGTLNMITHMKELKKQYTVFYY